MRSAPGPYLVHGGNCCVKGGPKLDRILPEGAGRELATGGNDDGCPCRQWGQQTCKHQIKEGQSAARPTTLDRCFLLCNGKGIENRM